MNKVTEAQIDRCDLEPVNFIGAIQPFGALLAFDVATFQLKFSSKNWASVFETGMPDPKKFDFPESGAAQVSGEGWSGTAFRSQNLLVIEGERGALGPSSRPEKPALERLHQAGSLKELLQICAGSVAELTGMDRVMIYRFHPDFHGEVVAETVKPGAESFLGLHYPASDIPAPARAMFLKSWVRIIPNVTYSPVPIECVDGSAKTFDLGGSLLRAVSPIHLEYLQNMKVAASCTISLQMNGELWGLVACHSGTPKMLGPEIRNACEMMGRLTSAHIAAKHENDLVRIRDRYHQTHKALAAKMKTESDFGAALTKFSPNLIDLISADGSSAALYLGGAWVSIGQVPTDEQLDIVVDWLEKEKEGEAVFATDSLPSLIPATAAFKDKACGMLALQVPKTTRNYILWFRPEVTQTVNWAGKPEKVEDSFGRLHPRASFAIWEQELTDHSKPWTELEIRAALELRTTIMAEDLQLQFRKEQEARAEAERAMAAREELMAVLSHDLKNPLGSIKLNAALLSRFIVSKDTEKLPPLVDRIGRAANNMNSLIDDILSITKLEAGYQENDLETQDVRTILQEAVDMLAPLAAEKNIHLSLELHHAQCNSKVDRGGVMQVFSNLIGNAIKFSPEGSRIEVSLETCGPENIVIAVKDAGPGIDPTHLPQIFDRFWQAKQTKKLGTGLGLAIAKAIIQSHGGSIRAESDGKLGTKFLVTLPLTN